MRRCFSGGMPMPVSLIASAITCSARLRLGWSDSSHPYLTDLHADLSRAVNLKALESRFLRICWSRFESLVKKPAVRIELDDKWQILALRHMTEIALHRFPERCEN